MKNLLTTSLLLALVACGGNSSPAPTSPPPPPPPPPVEGTLLSSECQEYTLVEQFADGQGGYTEEVTARSPACGWNPPPFGELSDTFCEEPYTLVSVYHDGEYGFYEEREARAEQCGWNPPPFGELSDTFCEDPYTLVSVYHDGEYGFYEEREADVEECGYIPPSLEVTIDNTYGDRFRPVIVTVSYTVQGEAAEWTYDVEMGRAVKVDDNTLHIYGDGSGDSVDLNLQINEESFLYQLKREPRCAAVQSDNHAWHDCQGYSYRGRSDGLIYYGEDDTQIVEWDIAFHFADRRAEGIIIVDPEKSDPLELNRWNHALDLVDKYNETYEANGIYIRYKLVGVAISPYGGLSATTSIVRENFNADVGLGLNTACPNTCGCAYPGTRFYENSGRAQIGVSVCSYLVDLHEIGHAVGLAHGPENSSNEGWGYIFPEFGHGWSTPFCSFYIDIMSYGGTKAMHHNSENTCEDYLKLRPDSYIAPEEYDDSAGDRRFADAAYALNRVRYDVSLISRTDPAATPELLPEYDPEASEHPRIDDHVRHYPNAEQMIRARQREFSRLGGLKEP